MEQKYKQIKINVTPEEHTKLQELSQEKNLKLSGYIRHLIHCENVLDKKTKHITQKTYTPIDPNLLREINKIGNNINQISKYLNIKKEIDYNILESLEKIEQYIKTLIKEV